MYGMLEHEIVRQHQAEIRQQVVAIRLAKAARANREERSRPMGEATWELERYAGLLVKRLRNLGR